MQTKMTPEPGPKIGYLLCFVVISIAVTGYFIGLQSPMNPAFRGSVGQTSQATPRPSTGGSRQRPFGQDGASETGWMDGDTILATHYSEMREATKQRAANYRTSLADLRSQVDPLADFEILPGEKAFALELREQNRAFNGAPPTVPHAIEHVSTQSCMACHGEGFKSESLRISQISHQYLTNCTQCHVEANPTQIAAKLFRENTFVGLPAPTSGPRAYENAPPMIPHSTWMRVDCTSCHGITGHQGIRTTHPWRQNCQQCHAPSSALDQVPLNDTPRFLDPPDVKR